MRGDYLGPEAAQFPPMVVVAVNNVCHYRCTHCYYPTYTSRLDWQPHYMALATFKHIVDEMAYYPHSALRLIAWGEPLLHPDLIDFVKYAQQAAPRNKRTLITNGHLLNEERATALMAAGLDLVEISIDAATNATYRRVRVAPGHPEAFFTVQRNVEATLGIRERRGFPTRIVVSYVVFPNQESEGEFELFRNRWRGLADDVLRRPAHTFKRTVSLNPPVVARRPPCYALWARCSVNPWGRISVCYSDWEEEHLLGDIEEPGTSIAQVWWGEALWALREGQQHGVFREPCGSCLDFDPDSWLLPYEKLIGRLCL